MSRAARASSLCGTWPPTQNSSSGAHTWHPFVAINSIRALHSQVGQTSTEEVKKRDLRAELLAAEQEARNKKRKAEGKAPLIEDMPADDEANKRRKLLQDIELDKDDDDEQGKKDDKQADDANDRCAKVLSIDS